MALGPADSARETLTGHLARHQTWRTWLGVGAATAALALAGAAAILSGPDGRFAYGVETVSAAATALLQRPAAAVPRLYALAAGMTAALNPCGLALVPAYLGLYLGRAEGREPSLTASLGRAVWVSLAVTASFLLAFALVGIAVGAVGSALTALFPWIGVLVGLILVIGGGRILAGGAIYSSAGDRLADRLGATASSGGVFGYAAYGLAYALASLGCALPIFLGVVGSALVAGSWLAGLLQFILYGVGMAAVLAALTVAAAAFEIGFLARLRRISWVAEPLSAVLLLLVGAYVIYYWLTLGGILAL